MVYFQQSLFGKMSWERFHQMTGWILEPSYPLSQTPMFQCLLLEDGQEPEWCEGERLTSAGGSWTPSIGQAPGWHDGSASFLWQTLEDGVPTKYFLSPAQCSHFLHVAEIAGCPPPAEIEALLLKQGGVYQLPDPFNASVKGLGENLRKIAMHTTNEFVTAAVNANHAEGVATWCYFDEFHILLRDPLTASYFVAVWKMLRKKGCVPSALTQNVKDLLASREIENILDNTDFMILLSQAQSDRAILAKQIGISEHQLSYITQSNSGEGLLFYGSVTIPFVDRFPRGEIYDLLTTKPEDAANGKQAE